MALRLGSKAAYGGEEKSDLNGILARSIKEVFHIDPIGAIESIPN